jgi:hypothetical protein
MVFSLLPPTSIPFSLPPLSPGQVLAARDVAARAGLPFFITEYNNGLGGALSRDDSGAAAFIFRQVSPGPSRRTGSAHALGTAALAWLGWCARLTLCHRRSCR